MTTPTPPLKALYRYRPVSSGIAFADLADGQGWYSRYECLNDPHEGCYINKSGDPSLDHFIKSLRVLCLSSRNDNLLLWAHYAENHNGVCLRYEFEDITFRGQCFPVAYSPNVPILERVTKRPATGSAAATLSIGEIESKVFLTKSQDWSYEEEFRLLKIANKPDEKGERQPVPAKLTAIYFGLRTSPQTIAISDKLLQDQPNVEFWQASLANGEFRLVFAPIPRLSAR